jgi:integrase
VKSQAGLIVEFTLKTGMRIDVEVLTTTWDQIDFETRSVTVGRARPQLVKVVIPLR